MNRLTKTGFRITLGLIIAFAGTTLPARAGASQDSGVIAVNPPSADFGDVVERVQEVTRLIQVRNEGTSNLVVSDLKMMGPNVEDFWFSVQWPFTLPPGDQRQIVVSFGPSSEGPKEAVLRIVSNAGNQSQMDVPLKGTGLGLGALGRISASAAPNNSAPHPGDLITVGVRVNMNGANPPAHLMQNYQATLSWDPAVLSFQGFTGGDSPWSSPASIGQANGSTGWFDSTSNGAGGNFTIIRFKFKVIGTPGSSTSLNLGFSRMEGKDVENLLPILSASGSRVEVVGQTAPPDIEVNPATYTYGAVAVGSRASRTFVVSNTGMQNLAVNAISLSGINANQFSIVSGGGAFTLPAGQSREVAVSFNPTYRGTKAAILLIRSNDPDEGLFYVLLSGSVAAPDIVVTPTSLNFGNGVLGSSVSRTLVVRNKGTGILLLAQFGLDGHQNQFAYNTGFLPFLLPGRSANIVVYFRPSTEGVKNATFVIHSNDPGQISVSIPLTGKGIRRP